MVSSVAAHLIPAEETKFILEAATAQTSSSSGKRDGGTGVSPVEKLVFGLGFSFYVFWTLGHGSAYFTRDLAWIFEDFKQTLFRPTVPEAIPEYFYACCLEPIFVRHLNSLRLHIFMSGATGFLMLLQVSPQFRKGRYARHRALGSISNTLTLIWLVHIGYILFIRGLEGLPDIIWWFDVIGLVGIVFGLVFGMVAILQYRNVRLHRAFMMICAAGMWSNATQRFFWAILSQTNSTMRTAEDWVDGPLLQSSVLAHFFNFGFALYYGFSTNMHESDLEYGERLKRADAM